MTYIRWFEEVGAADVALVGGKAANLGEMAVAGLPVPPGFCLAAVAYRDFIQAIRLNANYDEVIRLDPDYAEAYYGRGIAYHDLGDYEKAIADFESYLELGPPDAEFGAQAEQYIQEMQGQQ